MALLYSSDYNSRDLNCSSFISPRFLNEFSSILRSDKYLDDIERLDALIHLLKEFNVGGFKNRKEVGPQEVYNKGYIDGYNQGKQDLESIFRRILPEIDRLKDDF